MSRKISTQTNMNDIAAVKHMAERLSLKANVNGKVVTLTGKNHRSYTPTVIDTATGLFEGDEDNTKFNDDLKQNYAVSATILACEGEGYAKEAERVLPDGRVVLEFIRY